MSTIRFENMGWYLIPFEIINYTEYTKELSKYDRVDSYQDCRYLFSYVTNLFENGDNAYIKVYQLTKSVIEHFKQNTIFPHKAKDKNGNWVPYDCVVSDIRIITFNNNIGILMINIKFQEMTLDEIANFTNAFKKMGNGHANEGNTEQKHMDNKYRHGTHWQSIQTILNSKYIKPFFFANQYDNYEAFTMLALADYIVGNNDEETDKLYSNTLTLLKNGLQSNVDTSRYQKMASVELAEYPYIRFGASQNAMVCLVNKALVTPKDRSFIENRFSKSIQKSYLCLYLLLLNQRLTLLLAMYKSIQYRDDADKLQQIQKELNQFKMVASFNVISNTGNYQCLYDAIYEVLRIDVLYKDVDEINQKVMQESDIEDTQREKRANKLLIVISVLSVFSALVDLSDFLQTWLTGGYSGLRNHSEMNIGTGSLIFIVMAILLYIIVNKLQKKHK